VIWIDCYDKPSNFFLQQMCYMVTSGHLKRNTGNWSKYKIHNVRLQKLILRPVNKEIPLHS